MTTKLICNRCGEYEQDCLCEPPVECEKCKKYASELSALQKENAELKELIFLRDEQIKSLDQLIDALQELRTHNRELRSAIEEVMSHRREDKNKNYVLWIGEGTFLKCEQALALQPEK